MSNFFILGLPRHRTCWLANFFTYNGLFCYHEGAADCATFDEYKSKLGTSCGDSTTGLGLLAPDIMFPNAKIIVLDGCDPAVSAHFLYKTMNDVRMTDLKTLTTHMCLIRDALIEVPGLHIAYDKLDDHLCEMWHYITDKPFDFTRAKELQHYNVQEMEPSLGNLDLSIGFIHDWKRRLEDEIGLPTV